MGSIVGSFRWEGGGGGGGDDYDVGFSVGQGVAICMYCKCISIVGEEEGS